MDEPEEGVKELEEGVKEPEEDVKELAEGVQELEEGVQELEKGLLNSPSKTRVMDSRIDTGILDWGEPVSSAAKPAAASAAAETSLDLDWSQPVTAAPKDELVLDWGDDKDEEDEDEEASKPIEMKPTVTTSAPTPASPSVQSKWQIQFMEKEEDNSRGGTLDIMAQQLKFVACLKILMEELSTLATGFEVDGGQLRYQLYVWLEREVEALRQLCNYSSGDGEPLAPNEYETGDPYDMRDYTSTPTMMRPGEKPTLHEILMAEKLDFEAKVQRAAKRKRWLKANETLLR
ncbi:hypothetical protein FOCC_FOCC017897, partial [Frankliniella occidentalis]